MASTFRVLETRWPRSSGSRPSRSVSGRVVQRPANEADLEGDFFTFRAVVRGRGGDGFPNPSFRLTPRDIFVTVLTHDGGIIMSFAISCPGARPRGLSERRTRTAEDRGDDSCHRGQTRQSALCRAA